MSHAAWLKATKDLPTKSAKIRALDALGVARADIARFLGIRYQHVRNVLTQERPAMMQVREAPAPRAHEAPAARATEDGGAFIPPALADALGAQPGEILVAVPQEGGLWIATKRASRARAQATVRKYVPEGVSLVDDLLEMRRHDVELFNRRYGFND